MRTVEARVGEGREREKQMNRFWMRVSALHANYRVCVCVCVCEREREREMELNTDEVYGIMRKTSEHHKLKSSRAIKTLRFAALTVPGFKSRLCPKIIRWEDAPSFLKVLLSGLFQQTWLCSSQPLKQFAICHLHTIIDGCTHMC